MTDHSDIAQRVDDVLRARHAKREQVDEVCAALEELEARFSAFVRDVEAVAGTTGDSPELRSVASDVRATFVDGVLGHSYSSEVRDVLRLAIDGAHAVRDRVNRGTVNLGVIGVMKAGKSTLLRSTSGLGDDVIPSAELGATTAALSRIVNHEGQSEAELSLHSWASFRDEYLSVLHESVDCGPAPRTLEAFAEMSYPKSEELADDEISKRPFIVRLHQAQDSLASYRQDLESGGSRRVAIEKLRPYVAYPRSGDPDNNRPYHAVKEICIRTRFPDIPASRISLVDLPGAGEAGLDVDRHFIRRLHNNVDILLMVKYPEEQNAAFEDADWGVVRLVEDARCGVSMHDFFFTVINRRHKASDSDAAKHQRLVDHARTKLDEALQANGVRILEANASDPDEVRREVILPVLEHLASRLAEMDRAAMVAVLERISNALYRISAYQNAVAERVESWRTELGSDSHQLRKAANRLRIEIGNDLGALVADYDQRVADSEPDPTIMEGIAGAEEAVRGWLAEWLPRAGYAMGVDAPETVQDDYRTVRREVGDAYGKVELSLGIATDQLHLEIATVLRRHLTADLVGDPSAPETMEELERIARRRGAGILADAIAELRSLQTGYGNMVLRVGRPLIRRLSWESLIRAEEGVHAGVAGSTQSLDDKARELFGATRREPAGGPEPSTEVQTRSAAPHNAEELRAAIQADVDECLVALRSAISAEAKGLASVLACAADLFADRVLRTNDVEQNYEDLCEPHQVEIWPDLFGGEAARLSETLINLAESSDEIGSLVNTARSWSL